MKNFIKTLFLAAILISTVLPQKKAFTIADLYKIKNIGSPVISPDGRQIAFTVTSYNLSQGS